ncbi:hypothetical protein [Hymenobacter koreensis]|uniref:Uncharacterized protein n=1 Tax=Hymenobacter koreensis TaxID=1084523 RepID=A0ABP8JN20_9BACT
MSKPLDLRSLDTRCGGTGFLTCECGGDFCCCALNGGLQCGGCPDCDEDEADAYYGANYMPDCERCGEELAHNMHCHACGLNNNPS